MFACDIPEDLGRQTARLELAFVCVYRFHLRFETLRDINISLRMKIRRNGPASCGVIAEKIQKLQALARHAGFVDDLMVLVKIRRTVGKDRGGFVGKDEVIDLIDDLIRFHVFNTGTSMVKHELEVGSENFGPTFGFGDPLFIIVRNTGHRHDHISADPAQLRHGSTDSNLYVVRMGADGKHGFAGVTFQSGVGRAHTSPAHAALGQGGAVCLTFTVAGVAAARLNPARLFIEEQRKVVGQIRVNQFNGRREFQSQFQHVGRFDVQSAGRRFDGLAAEEINPEPDVAPGEKLFHCGGDSFFGVFGVKTKDAAGDHVVEPFLGLVFDCIGIFKVNGGSKRSVTPLAAFDHFRTNVHAMVKRFDVSLKKEIEKIAESTAHIEDSFIVEVAQFEQRFKAFGL